jgi:hypothetical protein
VNAKRTRSRSDIIFNLMILCGIILPIAALPEGVQVLLMTHFQEHMDWHDAALVALSMVLMMAVTGLILLQLGKFLLARLKRRESATASDTCSGA